MVVVFGTRTAGQVDVVEGRFFVATEFFHIMWFPLVPVSSWVVVDRKVADRYDLAHPSDVASEQSEQTGQTPNGHEPSRSGGPLDRAKQADSRALDTDTREVRYHIPMSGKSVLLGYLRGWGFWLGIVLGFLGGMLALMSGEDAEAAGMFPGFLYVAGGALAVALGSYYGPWNRATPQRARQLCEIIGMDPKVLPDALG